MKGFWNSESYGHRVKKAADPLEKENPNIADEHSHSVTDPHVRWNNVIHCVVDQQVKEIYGCLTVDREYEF